MITDCNVAPQQKRKCWCSCIHQLNVASRINIIGNKLRCDITLSDGSEVFALLHV